MRFTKAVAVLAATSVTAHRGSPPRNRHHHHEVAGFNHHHGHGHGHGQNHGHGSDHPSSSWFSWLQNSIFGHHHCHHDEGTTPEVSVDEFRRLVDLKYSEKMLLRFNVSTPAEQDAMYNAISTLVLDVWSVANGRMDISILADDVKILMGMLPESLHEAHSVISNDISSLIYDTYPHSLRESVSASQTIDMSKLYSEEDIARIASSDDLFFQDYQPLAVITQWMQLLQAMFPSIVSMVNIGQTYEGRDIKGIRVGAHTDHPKQHARKTLLVTGGLHAREWISTSTVNYLAWAFVTEYGKDHVVTKLLDTFDIVFLPVLNPDGFEYTWTNDRLWRKSRQPTDSDHCQGLDLDHAFSFGWDGASAVHRNPCSEGYAGQKPFDAVEASRLASWARNLTENGNTEFVGLVDLHSYSQQVLIPYSYSCRVEPPNIENLQEVAAGLTKAIRLADGETYTIASACEGVVTQSNPRGETGGGSAIDWFYHEMKAHYSYQIKLQDIGIYGFLLPKEYIVPSGQEMLSVIKYLGDFLLGNNGIEHFAESGVSGGESPKPNGDEDREVEL